MATKIEILNMMKKIEKLEKRLKNLKEEVKKFFEESKKLSILSSKKYKDYMDTTDAEIKVVDDILKEIKWNVEKGYVRESDKELLNNIEAKIDQIQILLSLCRIGMEVYTKIHHI